MPSLLLDPVEPVGVRYLVVACNPWLRCAATGFGVEHLRCYENNWDNCSTMRIADDSCSKKMQYS